MNGIDMFDFGWVLLLAAVAGVLSVRFKVPPVVGLLFAGMLIGPNFLNLLESNSIEIIAEIGAILLLFMVGIEFSIAKLFSVGLRAVLCGFLLILVTFAIMHEIAILMGFDSLSSIFLASVFSMSSTAIMMKILEQKKFVERKEIPFLITILVIEDIVAVFLLTFFSNLKIGNYDAEGIISALLISIGILVFAYVLLLRVIRKLSVIFFRYQTEDTLILFSLTLGIGLSAFASMLGLTPAIGAFLAGSIIAGLPNGKDFEKGIRPFSVVFSSFFFLSIGMFIDPVALLVSLDITLILVFSFIITVFLATTVAFYLISSDGRSSVFAGLAMIPLGEFSLLIAREGVGLVPLNLISIVSIGVLISSVLSSSVLRSYNNVYLFLKKTIPHKVLDTLKNASGYSRNVLTAFEPHGYFRTHFVKEVQSVKWDITYIAGIILILWFSVSSLQFTVSVWEIETTAHTLFLTILTMLSVIPIYRVLRSSKHLLDVLSIVFSQSTSGAKQNTIVRNLLISAISFIVFVNYSLFVESLSMPQVFNWFSLVFGLISLFFFWSAIRASSTWFFLSGRKPLSIHYQTAKTRPKDLVIVASSKKPKQKKNRYNS
ncbi:MAG: cation:proton antiporter [Candidatus Micrarchaeota archaeon]